ncbi:helix-turn-helix domain-containing protein [Solirubrobacter phytolaccae]|uniref:Helix-turn-helix domain-containing protein n=1 Tax=Solirubrobacter phytolaccae TaxID=1404360 RepID=A0A9X3S921_9ACTN|nr:helix-turn-helix transcriptional regulator [Solirubrobacter phytolaccae]MDA0178790.1 helix-turn-helix domain-containing protein [Solirubrobacter phytolaccae]
MDQPPLHDLLRGLRESRGRTLRQAARDLDFDPAYLSRVERGEKPVSGDLLQRASNYYDVPEELLSLSRGVVPQDIIAVLQRHPELLLELRERFGAS